MNHPHPKRILQLGISQAEQRQKPYGHFYNPKLGALPSHAKEALLIGPVAGPILPTLADAPLLLTCEETELENGLGISADGCLHVAIRTDLPDVTPAMIDWWFGWHSAEPQRYKLWHPRAHVYAAWQDVETQELAAQKGRPRYVGRVSFVDEYLGSTLTHAAIGFVPPKTLGFDEALLADAQKHTVIAARVSLAETPLDAGYLIHHVRKVPGGSEMRSRFWLGGPYAAVQAGNRRVQIPSAVSRRIRAPTLDEGRDLLVHCSQEMSHLATFLPKLYAEFFDVA